MYLYFEQILHKFSLLEKVYRVVLLLIQKNVKQALIISFSFRV